ncbi:MAG: hypothetical protein K0R15_2947, partial [Clostridiales bacterium]|nr:hypothetical protein [Clostridiales bacterium]
LLYNNIRDITLKINPVIKTPQTVALSTSNGFDEHG